MMIFEDFLIIIYHYKIIDPSFKNVTSFIDKNVGQLLPYGYEWRICGHIVSLLVWLDLETYFLQSSI